MENLSEMSSGIWTEEAETVFASESPDVVKVDGASTLPDIPDKDNSGEVLDSLPVSAQAADCETDSKSSQEDGKTAEEAIKRAEHEAAEAIRKAEWEAAQQAKKAKIQEQLERIKAMADEDVMAESMKRVSADTEKLTRRNMKECVSEYIQTKCLDDPAFARQVMSPEKSMIHCFWYINRKAREFVEQEMKNNDIRPETVNGVYGSDVPDDLCYQWAEDYFHDPDAEEDKEKEVKFVPRPFKEGSSLSGKTKKAGKENKKKEKQVVKENTDPEKNTEVTGQLSFLEQMTLPGLEREVAAG